MNDEILPPRTIAGQAALSGMRPHIKRALAQTIRRIEDEAARPYAEALREADAVLAEVAGGGGEGDAAAEARLAEVAGGGGEGDAAAEAGLAGRARAARRRAAPLLADAAGEGE